jgi:formamidopyrimidine-DNA glycosylase
MPEWPDVEIFKQYLDATSLHRKIRTVTVHNRKVLEGISPEKLRQVLQGHSFESTTHHGKYLFVEIDNQYYMVLHFGMTGSLRYSKNDRQKESHDRVVFSFVNGYKLVYVCQRLLGHIGLVKSVTQFLESHELGPDAFSVDMEEFKKIFKKSRGGAKSTLMNQKLIAGIGNIYSDEILFQAGINPEIQCSKLTNTDTKNLCRNMKKVLRRAVERKADPQKLPESYLLVHRQKGGSCPRCHNEIRTKKIAGRTAFFCPKCQK